MDSEPPDPGLIALSIILLAAPIGLELIGQFIILALLLFFSGLVSGSEVAYFSLTPKQIAELESDGNKSSSNKILQLKETPRTLLATILILNNFINIAIVVLSDFILWHILPETTFQSWSLLIVEMIPTLEPQLDALTRGINFVVTVAGVTFILVLLGEVTPKVYAKINNLQLAHLMAHPLMLFKNLLWPVSRLLVQWSNKMENKISYNRLSGDSVSRKEEIDRAIDLTVSHDLDSESEVDILKSIVKFGDVSVKQIMTPRVNVVAIDFASTLEQVFDIIRESGYSRLPVYKDDLDNLVGLLYIKDLVGKLEKSNDSEWQELIRSNLLYVTENKKINELLKEFQQKRMHMGIVVDEYGGCSGIVTLEDIMEEVIGEIRDEFDSDEEHEFVKLDHRNFVFEGKTQLNDVCRIMSIDTNTFDKVRGESDTIAGLFLELLGKIPKQEQEISVGAFKFKALVVTKRRIEKVKISILY